MISLITNHDKYHIHKILGGLCLFNYNFSIFNKIYYGHMFSDNFYIKAAIPIVHLSLSLSSFIFHVPLTRFASKIIIWKELQLHNIIFTSRSATIMLYSLYSNNIYGRCFILVAHHLFADYITFKYGNNKKTTTRDIPYNIENKTISYLLKKYYAASQLMATSALLLSDNGLYENAFIIMYPIQLSTFLSTLVRKNIIDNNLWHIFYSISLTLPVLISQFTKNVNPNYLIKIKLTSIFILSRLLLNTNKYLCITGLVSSYKLLNCLS